MTFDRTAVCCVASIAMVTLSSCGGGGNSAAPSVLTPTAPPIATFPITTFSPTPTATPGGASATAFTCPATGSGSTSASRASAGDAVARALRREAAAPASAATVELAVTFDDGGTGRAAESVGANETRAGATFLQQMAYPALGRTLRILAVPAAQARSAAAVLRDIAGVRSVDVTALPRYALAVAGPAYPNDPYFNGFTTTVPIGGVTPAATFHVPPYDESASVPGQWDMHAIRLEYAFAYAKPANGSAVSNANAAGSAAVKIALIDTGEDAHHPELAAKIGYQHCFITNTSTGVQSSGSYANDPDGHGTNVTGIAAAGTNNALGFAAAGGASSVDAYRVFPTPDDACATPGSTDAQCQSSSRDVAAAIDDAVVQGANVISMSLGAGTCTNGTDPDPVEGAAVANAIAHHVIVVAASGNGGSAAVSAPACDAGVIAVGATALADGSTNGSGVTGGSAAVPMEYVPTYSSYGLPGAAVHSTSAWGIVAPGGDPHPDPSSDTTGALADGDDLHWIENIWTTTPFDAKFTGSCTPDYASASGTADCRVLIAGTSMSAPHVAGAAALIVAAQPGLQSASAMKALLCQTADDIGDPHEGCGRLNVERAMAVALGDPSPP